MLTFDTERAEAEHLADLLRRAHLEDGVPWDRMAVLVRSGRVSIPPLRRALGAAGVPVEVARDELPLVQDPSVLPLLGALRAAVNIDNDDEESADYVDHARAESLLLGPLGGLDAGDVRRLARLLRTREKDAAHAESRLPLTSKELVRLAVLRDGYLDAIAGPEAAAARAVHTLIRSTADGLADGGTAEDALWRLWSGTDWPGRLRRSVELGGGGARRAHRDLDSVVALFDVAAREAEKRDVAAVSGAAGVRDFLSRLVAQQIPADTLAEQGVRGAAVRLLTAHRSKGLEWDLVVVAHVQQEGWPDLRRRSTMLQADRIGTDGRGQGELVPPVTARELLQEERRLFYVACTRARSRLVVTAVASAEDDGEQPSRFLAELGVTIEKVVGRPARPLSLAGLVSELRRTVADPDTSDALRLAAARRLARLAGEEIHGRALVPQADPSSWWGTRAATRSVQPVRDPEKPVPVSASMLEHVMTCPAQWFLMTEAGGAGPAHQSANIGQLVHALAQRVAVGEVPPDLDLLMGHVDEVWGRLHFRTPWSAAREHERIETALTRFLEWHGANPRKLIGTEERFETVVELESGERVTLFGYADRLELDADGRDRGGGPQDDQERTQRPRRAAPRPARGLPVRRRPRRRRRPGAGRPRRVRRRRARPARPARRRRRAGAAAACVPRRRPRAHRAAPAGRPCRRARPRGDLPRRRRRPLPRLRLPLDLPDPGRRVGDLTVTTTPDIGSPEALAALMGWDFAPSPEQWDAIRAPLAPAVVIAGAGSGKTTLMAARVVYLVATGQVRPDQVLGLTFTTKAASQLRTKVREALLAAGLLPSADLDDHEAGDDTIEPTVATYNAYAARLLTDHGLRIGHEPDTRVLSDASRYQLGRPGRGAAHRRGPVPHRPPADRDPEPPRPRRRDE